MCLTKEEDRNMLLQTDRQDNYDFEIGNRKQRSNRLKNVFLLHGVYKKTFFYLVGAE